MTSTLTYGPWITWEQGPCPLSPETEVQIEMNSIGSNDFLGPMKAEELNWDMEEDNIARYRIVIAG